MAKYEQFSINRFALNGNDCNVCQDVGFHFSNHLLALIQPRLRSIISSTTTCLTSMGTSIIH